MAYPPTLAEKRQEKIEEVEAIVEHANQALMGCLAWESELQVAKSAAEKATAKAERHLNEAEALLAQLRGEGLTVPGEWPTHE